MQRHTRLTVMVRHREWGKNVEGEEAYWKILSRYAKYHCKTIQVTSVIASWWGDASSKCCARCLSLLQRSELNHNSYIPDAESRCMILTNTCILRQDISIHMSSIHRPSYHINIQIIYLLAESGLSKLKSKSPNPSLVVLIPIVFLPLLGAGIVGGPSLVPVGKAALGNPVSSGGKKVNPPSPTDACVFLFAGVGAVPWFDRYEVGGLEGIAICSNVDTLVDCGIGEWVGFKFEFDLDLDWPGGIIGNPCNTESVPDLPDAIESLPFEKDVGKGGTGWAKYRPVPIVEILSLLSLL